MPLFKLKFTKSDEKQDKKQPTKESGVSTVSEKKTNVPSSLLTQLTQNKSSKKSAPRGMRAKTPVMTLLPAPSGSRLRRGDIVSQSPMTHIMERMKAPPEEGDLVEGVVLGAKKNSLFVDLPPFGTGIIFGREYNNAKDIIKKISVGDTITAKVVEKENEDGYIELSLKEARQAIIWNEADEAIRNKTIFELQVKEANKGGLIIEWRGIAGFLPASQLKPEHYPRVEGGSKDKVLAELQKFVGKNLHVSIISALPQENKLIFSEKEPVEQEKSEKVLKYSVGDVVEGEVTGIVDFGLFVKVEEGLEGLVHISEMDWGLVENPRALFSVGQKITAQIIEVKEGKISLSVKALKANPWIEAAKKYKRGDTVTGVVIRYNRHGALMSIEEGVAGLVHISEFGTEEKLKEELELGKTYPVAITLFEPSEQRMTLSFKSLDSARDKQPTTDSAKESEDSGDEGIGNQPQIAKEVVAKTGTAQGGVRKRQK